MKRKLGDLYLSVRAPRDAIRKDLRGIQADATATARGVNAAILKSTRTGWANQIRDIHGRFGRNRLASKAGGLERLLGVIGPAGKALPGAGLASFGRGASAVGGGAAGLLGGAVSGIAGAATSVLSMVSGPLGMALEVAKKLGGLIIGAFETIVSGIVSSISSAVSFVVGKLGDLLGFVGRWSKRIGIAAAVGFAYLTYKSAQFEEEMVKSLSIMQGRQGMEQKLAAQARAMAKELGIGNEEVAKSYFYLASAGLDATKSIAAMPVVMRFAKAGSFDAAAATDMLTDSVSAMGMASDDPVTYGKNLAHMADVITKGNIIANTSVEQLAEAMTNKAATAARSANISLEDMVATLVTFADQGKKGAEAGTLFAFAMTNIKSAYIKHKALFKKYGIEVYDETKGELYDLTRVFASFDKSLGKMSGLKRTQALMKMGFSERAIQAVNLMFGQSDKMAAYRKQLDGVSGETKRLSDEIGGTFLNSIRRLKVAFENIGITIGRTTGPMLQHVTESAIAAAGAFENWIGKKLKALEPTLARWGVLLNEFWENMTGVRAGGASLVEKVFDKFVGGVTTVLDWLSVLSQEWDDTWNLMQNRAEYAWEIIKQYAENAWEVMKAGFEVAWEAMEPIAEKVMERVTQKIEDVMSDVRIRTAGTLLRYSEESIVAHQSASRGKRYDERENEKIAKQNRIAAFIRGGLLNAEGNAIPGRQYTAKERKLLASLGVRIDSGARGRLNKALQGPGGPTARMKELGGEKQGILDWMEAQREVRETNRRKSTAAAAGQGQIKLAAGGIWGGVKSGLGTVGGLVGKFQQLPPGAGQSKKDRKLAAREAAKDAWARALVAGKSPEEARAAAKAAEDAALGKKPKPTGLGRLGGILGAAGRALGVGAMTPFGLGAPPKQGSLDDINSAGDRAAAVAKRAGASPAQQEKARQRARQSESRKRGISLPAAGAGGGAAAVSALEAPKNAFVGFSEAAKAAQESIYKSGEEDKLAENASTTADATTRTAVATEKIAEKVASGDVDWEGS